MEEDPSFGFPRRHVVWNSSNWSMPDMRFKLGNPNMGFPLSNTTYEVISMDGLLPLGGFPGLPHSRLNQCGEHLGWSYGLPRYSQAFSPAIRNIYLKDDLSVDPSGTCIIPGKPDGVDVSGSPKLFVFDQSGDQATIIFGPETNRFPIPHIPMATPKQLGIIVSGGGGKTGGTANASKGQYENEDPDVQSEMHEDTEELNALLYSDEEFNYLCDGDEDNDEVTSTGHSPSTMTAHWDHGFGPSKKVSEEVNSSLWPQGKKRKLSNECRNPPSSADSYEAKNLIGNFDSDDALSSSGDRETISQNRDIKRARISETVGVLESLVPGMKGKNPVEVLDEAIKYLKSLKLKAAVFHGTGSCQKLVEQV